MSEFIIHKPTDKVANGAVIPVLLFVLAKFVFVYLFQYIISLYLFGEAQTN